MSYQFEVFKGGVLKKKWYFRFLSSNGEKMCQSEGYSRRTDAQAAVETIKREAPAAEVIVEED